MQTYKHLLTNILLLTVVTGVFQMASSFAVKTWTPTISTYRHTKSRLLLARSTAAGTSIHFDTDVIATGGHDEVDFKSVYVEDAF